MRTVLELACSVLEFTEKFQFDCVRLPNQSINNRENERVRLIFRSIDHLRVALIKSDLLYQSPIPMQDRKNRFSENLSGRRFLLTCFKTVTLRLLGFLFSSPDGLLYFAPQRAKFGPEITLFAKASKPKYCAYLEKLTHIIKI